MTQFFQLTDLGLIASQSDLIQQWLSAMQTQYPGYTPSPGNLEYIQAQIFASWAAALAEQTSQGANELFRQFGQKLFSVPPLLGTSATGVVSITAADTLGHTISAGTQFVLDSALGFSALQDVVIPSGSSSAPVTIVAGTPGTDHNGAGNATVQLNQQLDWVTSVTLVSAANGGVDAETDDQYQSRLAIALQLMAPRPITASDYGNFSLNFSPAPLTDQQEVGRAAAIDGYDPNTNTYNNERTVCVAVADTLGNALNADTLVAVQTWLQTLREANFIINVVSPSYSPIYVTCSIVRDTTYTVTAVQQSVQNALINLLSPFGWGLPTNSIIGWQNQTTVYESLIESTIQSAGGVDHIVTGTLGTGLNPNPGPGAVDLVLPGPFPLPTTSNGATIPLTGFTVVN